MFQPLIGRRRALAATLSCGLAALLPAAGCAPASNPDIEVTDARIRAPLPGRDMTAGYFTLRNDRDAALVLTGVTSPAARAVEMHETSSDGGMMKMRRLDEVVVGAGETVRFEPGGRHLMLFGVSNLGERTEITLNRRNGDPIVVPFTTVAVSDG